LAKLVEATMDHIGGVRLHGQLAVDNDAEVTDFVYGMRRDEPVDFRMTTWLKKARTAPCHGIKNRHYVIDWHHTY